MRLKPVQINVNNEKEFIKKAVYFSNSFEESALFFSNKIKKTSYPSIIMNMILSLLLVLQSQ